MDEAETANLRTPRSVGASSPFLSLASYPSSCVVAAGTEHVNSESTVQAWYVLMHFDDLNHEPPALAVCSMD